MCYAGAVTRQAVSQVTIERAIRAARAQGLEVAAIEISPDGVVRILTGAAPPSSLTPLEKWREETKDARARRNEWDVVLEAPAVAGSGRRSPRTRSP
jgi:hypothetical protein